MKSGLRMSIVFTVEKSPILKCGLLRSLLNYLAATKKIQI